MPRQKPVSDVVSLRRIRSSRRGVRCLRSISQAAPWANFGSPVPLGGSWTTFADVTALELRDQPRQAYWQVGVHWRATTRNTLRRDRPAGARSPTLSGPRIQARAEVGRL